MLIKTYSIVAYDPAEQAFGVGVASKFLAVGAVVPWAKASVGAIAMLLVVAEWAYHRSDHHARPGGDAEEGLWRRASGGCEWREPERQRQCAGWPRVRQPRVDGALCSCAQGG